MAASPELMEASPDQPAWSDDRERISHSASEGRLRPGPPHLRRAGHPVGYAVRPVGGADWTKLWLIVTARKSREGPRPLLADTVRQVRPAQHHRQRWQSEGSTLSPQPPLRSREESQSPWPDPTGRRKPLTGLPRPKSLRFRKPRVKCHEF
jgi:hypothetical protein